MSVDRQALLAELGLAMQRYQRSTQAFDDAVSRRLRVGPADLRCLDWLADGPKTAGQLSAATGLRPAATTAMIDRLVAKGLVERARSETDRRQVIVRMTAYGRAETDVYYQPLVTDGQLLLAEVDEQELALMRNYLTTITELTDRHRDRLAADP